MKKKELLTHQKEIETHGNDEAFDRYFGLGKWQGVPKTHPKIKEQVQRMDWILKQIPVLQDKILDIGSGSGLGAYVVGNSDSFKRVEGIEAAMNMVEEARNNCKDLKNVTIKHGFAEDLKHKDNTFDCVLMNEVLEHVHDVEKSINEAYRVLLKGGKIVITVPNGGGLSRAHLREFNTKKICDLISKKFQINYVATIGRWIGLTAFKI